MSEIKSITQKLIAFRDARHWESHHNSKDLALALSIEAAELNELFLWKNGSAIEKIDPERLEEELADVLAYAFMLAEKHHFDIPTIMEKKMAKNAAKYPL